jgi:hypothetical protein
MISQDIIYAICAWWRLRRLSRIMPDIIARKRQIADNRRRHRPTKHIIAEQQARMMEALRGGR